MSNKPDFEKLRREATPGPWAILPEEAHRPYIRIRGTILGCKYKIANVLLLSGLDDFVQNDSDEARANARLIASIHAIDDARIAAEEENARLRKQLAVVMEYVEMALISGNLHWLNGLTKKIEEIDNEE